MSHVFSDVLQQALLYYWNDTELTKCVQMFCSKLKPWGSNGMILSWRNDHLEIMIPHLFWYLQTRWAVDKQVHNRVCVGLNCLTNRLTKHCSKERGRSISACTHVLTLCACTGTFDSKAWKGGSALDVIFSQHHSCKPSWYFLLVWKGNCLHYVCTQRWYQLVATSTAVAIGFWLLLNEKTPSSRMRSSFFTIHVYSKSMRQECSTMNSRVEVWGVV